MAAPSAGAALASPAPPLMPPLPLPLPSCSGVPKLGQPGVRGNHQVHVRVTIPKSLSGDERKLVEQLRESQAKAKVGPFRF
jgi:hypothetical protein